MSKKTINELIRLPEEKFENKVSQMHFTEKNIIFGELFKRAEILGEKLIG